MPIDTLGGCWCSGGRGDRARDPYVSRALLAADARDGVVIRVDLIDGELTVTYEHSPKA